MIVIKYNVNIVVWFEVIGFNDSSSIIQATNQIKCIWSSTIFFRPYMIMPTQHDLYVWCIDVKVMQE